MAEDAKDLNQEVEPTPQPNPKDRINELKAEKRALKEENASLKENSVDKAQFEILQRQVDESRVEKLYGQENINEAIQLEQAGFDETKIKQFLKKSDMPADFTTDTEALGLKPVASVNEAEEETEEARDKRLDELRVLEEKENKKHSV